jgi:putative molybdopterin biosynthesis protein
MIEDTWQEGDRFQVRKAAAPWQHVRTAGEDIREGRLVLPRGHQVRAFDIGALATYGVVNLDVRTVKVGIIATGSELVPLGVRPAPGQVVESNTIMAQVFLQSMGAHCTRSPIVCDDPDFTADVLATLGELLFHGVAVKPGKPVMLGRIRGRPVIGLPGYPLAAQTVLREFVAPLLEWWGLAPPHRHAVRTRLSTGISSDLGFDEFVPVSVGQIGAESWGIAHSRGSGVQMATIRANGYLHIPAPVEGYDAGHEVEVTLTTDPGTIGRTILLTGVVDPALEELGAIASGHGIFLHAAATGNAGAILALRRGSCHAAPMSIPVSPFLGECRVIMPHLTSLDLAFVHIATLQQGIASREAVPPERLSSVRCVTTRKDSAERIILDALLASQGTGPSGVAGDGNEVANSAAVAAAVFHGHADAGICSQGAAAACGLRFVPVAQERYELVVCREMLGDPRIAALLSLVNSDEYRHVLERRGMYDTAQTGTIRRGSPDNPETIAMPRSNLPGFS